MIDKKEQILEAATRLFSERGFENTPISLICETVGVSKGLVFHHFKSKNELLRAIFSSTTKKIIELNENHAHEQSAHEQSAHEQLLDLVENFFVQLKSDKMFFQLNLTMIVQPNTREILNDLIKERASFIMNSVQNIFNEINPENSNLLSYTFIAELDGIALNYLSVFDDYPLDILKEGLLKKYKQLDKK